MASGSARRSRAATSRAGIWPGVRYSSRIAAFAAAALAAAALGSCGLPPWLGARPLPIGEIEERYQAARALRDEIDVTRSRGAETTTAGVPLADVVARYDAARPELARALAAGAAPPLSEEDQRALEVMRRTFENGLGLEKDAPEEPEAPAGEVECAYDAEEVAKRKDGEAALSKRIYACFSLAAHSLSFEGEQVDRVTVFGLMADTKDPARREALWMAFAPIWRAVNGDNGPRSPYRTLVRRNSARLRGEGALLGESVRSIGVEPAQMEEWLVSVLERWREITPDAPLEPWEFAYGAGQGNEALGARAPRESLRPINDRYYADLGADPVALDVQYDLESRPSKDPVAFTTFGRRPRTQGDAVIPGQPWVFASYQIGGLGNLAELLHETGHAVHIAAIRTRPAFTDWPDSDIFTEGIADLASLELYEPAWQQRYLGASAPIQASIAAKYSGIVVDIAWALFEVQVYRQPERDPNEVWTEITHRYFRVEPHPEVAWWAVRGQLVDAPGYMMNYAAGAILAADLRARIRERYGPYAEGDPGWYERAARDLYRFGRERSSKDVIEEFLGRPVSPQALLDDMARAVPQSGRAARPRRAKLARQAPPARAASRRRAKLIRLRSGA